MTLVITKRISLEFLGNEYKDGYITVKSIPLKELSSLRKDILALKDSKEENASINYIKTLVAGRFVEGKIPQNGAETTLTPDNLDELPIEVFFEVMNQLMGQLSPN